VGRRLSRSCGSRNRPASRPSRSGAARHACPPGCTLYSLSVVAATHPALASREDRLEDIGASDGRRAPIRRHHGMSPRRRTDRLLRYFKLAGITFWILILEHPSRIVPSAMLSSQLTTWHSRRRRTGTLSARLQKVRRPMPSAISVCRLPFSDADQHHRVVALAWQRSPAHCWNLLSRPKTRRHACPCSRSGSDWSRMLQETAAARPLHSPPSRTSMSRMRRSGSIQQLRPRHTVPPGG